MKASTPQELTIGFLTVVEPAEHLLIGGYLILNSKGRPVEFHCTAPVKPNRAQQILYGITLRPYICGEQIGQALIGKSKQKPVFICTDIVDVMELREVSSVPMLLVPMDTQNDGARSLAVVPDHFEPLELCAESTWLHPLDREQHGKVKKLWLEHFSRLSFAEPFGRIREAIREAHRDAAA